AAHQTLLRWAINRSAHPAKFSLPHRIAHPGWSADTGSESLCERANQLGQRLKNTLIDAKESVPAIAAVRGLGSMIAVEFNDPQTGEPSAAIAQKIQQRALAQGLLLLTCGAYGNVIRFLYPLTIPDAQFDAAMKILQDALSD
ncbi:aminotransferase class III-fold pyridoxal phosphate-dependent enzyme, partial [Escherichia coli]